MNGEYIDCPHCGGSGDDHSDWFGQCVFCNGRGEVWREFRQEIDQEDENDD